MHEVVRRRGSMRAALAFLGLFAGLVLLIGALGGSADARPGSKADVSVKVATKTQAELLKHGKLAVEVEANWTPSVKVSADAKGKGKLFRSRSVAVRGDRFDRTVKLKLTKAGKRELASCGTKRIKVTGIYRDGSDKGTAKDSRKLRKDRTRCSKPYEPVPTENADRCDFLDPQVCLQPFPNDYFTVNDPSTPTGKRLNLSRDSMPANIDGVHMDPTDINRADGFSPGNLITIKIPGVDTPQAFQNSGLVPENDIHAYDDPNQAVMVINADTGERQPIWAELDSNPTAVDPGPDGPGGIGQNPSNTGPVNLLIRPAKNFDFGQRYIVALRDLRDANDQPVPAPVGFRVYRDDDITDQPEVEARRPHMESIINTLTTKAGVDRSSLYMAWDFTVASEQSVTGRATTIRDDAFSKLGDTNLANRKIDGSAPTWSITRVTDDNPPAPGERNLPGQITRRVEGTIDVPCYLNQPGCPTGSSFAHAPNGDITWDPTNVEHATFRCEIPNSVETTTAGQVTPAAVGIYGHGLLGDQGQLTGQAAVADQANTIWCAMDFEGFANGDIPTVAAALHDMSNFGKLVDRMQQGLLNFMYLGRALTHPSGLATDPAFKFDPDGPGGNPPVSAIDTSGGVDTRLQYMGVSQGAIMGGALTALDPDVDRGVLNVTGMNYSTLLRRSVDSDEYFKLPGLGLYANYPDELERPVLLSLMQLLWDRGESNGYAHNMTTDPLPNTNPHEILLQAGLGDHQVANVAAEVEARTIGASVYSPALEPGRHWDVNPFMDIPQVTSFPYTGGSMLVYYDGGPVSWTGPQGQGTATAPSANVPPRTEWGYGGDPHGYPRASPDAMNQEVSFFDGNGIPRCADPADGYCFANGWTGTP
jgi:hypothetical protein